MAYDRIDIPLEIEQNGDDIRIRPARQTLENVLEKFAKFSDDFMSKGRENQEQRERDAL